MFYYDISCFRFHDKQYPSHIVYRLKFNGDDKNFPVGETAENSDLAKEILSENKQNSNAANALTGHFTRFNVFKYESYY